MVDATVSTLEVPGLGWLTGLLVLSDGTLLVSSVPSETLRLLTPSGLLATLAGGNADDDDATFVDGQGPAARFNGPSGITVDAAGHMVVADRCNHALRRVSKAGEVSTLAGTGEAGFADGQGDAARFNFPCGLALAANDEIVVADTDNHAIRVVTPGGAVRTLAGSGEAGFADGQGAAARFCCPTALARDKDGSILVADTENHAVRRVTMEGAVSTVAGNGVEGYADGEGAAARFNGPTAVVVDTEGTIIVADRDNERLRKIVGRQVATLAGGSEAGTADGVGAGARFNQPCQLALDERGRLLVGEIGREDTLRVVDASLAPPAWMGPMDAAAEAELAAQALASWAAQALEKLQDYGKLVEDYGKLVEAPELADVVLVVEGERFPAHRAVLAARSEYFRGMLLSGMQEGSGRQEIALGEVSAGAFRVVLRYLYTAEVPAWEEMKGTSADGDGAAEGGHGGGRRGSGGRSCRRPASPAPAGGGKRGSKGKGKVKGKGKGKGTEAAGNEEDEGARRAALELEVLKAADLFQAEGLLKHCLEGFRGGLTVHTAVEQLVWAHTRGPEEARSIGISYVVQHLEEIQVTYSLVSCSPEK
jgi:DNA-binding beta-propeller fold protein YncE